MNVGEMACEDWRLMELAHYFVQGRCLLGRVRSSGRSSSTTVVAYYCHQWKNSVEVQQGNFFFNPLTPSWPSFINSLPTSTAFPPSRIPFLSSLLRTLPQNIRHATYCFILTFSHPCQNHFQKLPTDGSTCGIDVFPSGVIAENFYGSRAQPITKTWFYINCH